MEKKVEPIKNEMAKKDYLVLHLQQPVEYGGTSISQLDLTGLRDLTGRELNVIYDLYASQGGGGVARGACRRRGSQPTNHPKHKKINNRKKFNQYIR